MSDFLPPGMSDAYYDAPDDFEEVDDEEEDEDNERERRAEYARDDNE